MRTRHAIRRGMMTLLFFVTAALPGQEAGEAFPVYLHPFETGTDGDVEQQLAETVEATIRLSFRLLPGVRLVRSPERGQPPVAIAGSVAVDEGVYTISVKLTDPRPAGEEQRLSVSTASVLEIFTLADRLTEEAVRSISRRDIAFGALEFEAQGSGNWTVRIDDEEFTDSPRRFDRIPVGRYRIRVFQEQAGAQVLVAETRTDIQEEQTATVAFMLQSPEEVYRRIVPETERVFIRSLVFGPSDLAGSGTTSGSTDMAERFARSQAAAEQTGRASLYAARLAAWRAVTTENTPGGSDGAESTSGIGEAAERMLADYLGRDVTSWPGSPAFVNRASTVFREQLTAWMAEQSPD